MEKKAYDLYKNKKISTKNASLGKKRLINSMMPESDRIKNMSLKEKMKYFNEMDKRRADRKRSPLEYENIYTRKGKKDFMYFMMPESDRIKNMSLKEKMKYFDEIDKRRWAYKKRNSLLFGD